MSSRTVVNSSYTQHSRLYSTVGHPHSTAQQAIHLAQHSRLPTQHSRLSIQHSMHSTHTRCRINGKQHRELIQRRKQVQLSDGAASGSELVSLLDHRLQKGHSALQPAIHPFRQLFTQLGSVVCILTTSNSQICLSVCPSVNVRVSVLSVWSVTSEQCGLHPKTTS